MSISGLHLGLVATIAFVSCKFILQFLSLHLTSRTEKISAIFAIIFTGTYALLSGLQIATIRALIIIAGYFLGKVFVRSINSWQNFYFSMLLVIIIDPLSVYTTGFWLSFYAVFILLYTSNWHNRKDNWFTGMLKIQIILLIGLFPLSAKYFSHLSLIAPIANLLAVPIVSFWVIPLAILSLFIQVISTDFSMLLLQLSHFGFNITWKFLEYLSLLQHMNINIYQVNNISMLLSCVGSLWILAPRGTPYKALGITCFLPVFFPINTNLQEGEFQFHLLDVGQGLATIIQTKKHTILYDTGLKYNDNVDSGNRVILPFLHTLGIKNIDLVLISHPDLDHFGGAQSIINNKLGINVNKLLINDLSAINNTKLKNIPVDLCNTNNNWEWDTIRFNILHPNTNPIGGKNEYSCVLKVTNKYFSILLPGDIGAKTEQKLVNLYSKELSSDVLVIPHHGSKHSSSIKFLQQVGAKIALISAGYLNRYHHPARETLSRLQQNKSIVLSTEKCGAISIFFHQETNKPLKTSCYRVNQFSKI
jgi:competence protein ComEC